MSLYDRIILEGRQSDLARTRELWGGKKRNDALLKALKNWARMAVGYVQERSITTGGRSELAIQAMVRDYDEKLFKQKVAPFMPNNATLSVGKGDERFPILLTIRHGKTPPHGFGSPKLK